MQIFRIAKQSECFNRKVFICKSIEYQIEVYKLRFAAVFSTSPPFLCIQFQINKPEMKHDDHLNIDTSSVIGTLLYK